MTDNTQPEALRLAAELDETPDFAVDPNMVDDLAAELRRQHARITELEAQLEAIGAGGVSGPLMGASLSANAGGEPVAEVVPCHTPSGKRVALRSEAQGLPIGTKLYTHPSPPEGIAGWTKASEQLPPCRDDQDYIGINTAGFAGVFNAVADIAGNVYCMMETAEESVSIMSDLDIWKPFIRPLPASPTIEGESNGK